MSDEPTPESRRLGCLFLCAVMGFTAAVIILAIKGLA